MELQIIDNDQALSAGDIIKIKITARFSFGQTFDAYLLAGQVARVEGTEYYEVLNYEHIEDGVILNVRIKDQARQYTAGIITPAVIITSVIGLSLIFLSVTTYKVVDRVADTVESPAGQIAVKTLPVIAIAGIGLAAYIFFKR